MVQKKFEQMQNFISISRTFSVKIHGHLKILLLLVNNLIESEDNVELVDTILKMPDFKEVHLQSYLNTVKSDFAELNTEEETQQPLDKFQRILQEENKKIQEHIQRGEQNTEFLKDVFHKMLDALQKQQNPNQSSAHEIINKITCPHCEKDATHVNLNCPHPHNQVHSMYLPAEDNRDYDKSVMSLKNELLDVKNEVRRLQEKGQENDLGKMVNKLMAQKKDLDD